ncbi:MAG: cobalamin-binding protein [Eggerthellaceae bacterium]|nr:cobalamin-binding protein [Eggerthellaceae bacterium]
MAILEDITSAVMRGKRKEVGPLVQQALDEGMDPAVILNDGLVPAMDVIGERFSAGEAFVPEMLVAARAMSAGTEVLKPHLVGESAEPVGKAVIGTVKGDMHDIGKNLVRMMIEAKGFQVEDLGVDVAPERFVEFIQENPDTDLVCCSSLLTTTMPEMQATVRAIEEAGLRDQVKVMVGGAPVTQAYADQIGADAYTEDAGAAAVRAVELVCA